jgi:predicted ArsR family transcriptional regulator
MSWSTSTAWSRKPATRARLADRYRAKRANSRVPQLYGLLASFGPLRSSQIEAVLGVTRLGVRKMLEALSEAGDLAIETVSGVKLYSVTRGRPSVPHRPGRRTEPVFQRGDRGL